MKRILITLLIAAALLSLQSCKRDYTAQIPPQFGEYCQKTFDEWNLPGMAVVVVKDGRTVFLKGYGKTSLQPDAKPVDPENTQFVIASTTKAMTAALLAITMDKYDVKWGDTVVNHLPDFRLYDKWTTANLLVKEVMTHKTGFKTYAMDDMPFFGYDRDDLYCLFSVLEPTYSFRTRYAYNNEMYTVIAKIIEKYNQESWDDAIAKYLFEPLEMKHSTTGNKAFFSSPDLALGCRVDYKSDVDSLVISPRDDREDAFTWLSAVAPAAFVMTTASDMANWLKMNLDHGEFNGKQVISRKNHDYLFYPQTITAYDSTRICAYAQGWTIEQSTKCQYIRHTGLGYGYTSLVGLVPELNMGIAILTNNGKTSDPQAAIARELIDMYLGVKGSDWSEKYLAQFKEDSTPKEQSEPEKKEEIIPQPLKNGAYTGKYDKPVFGTATVYEKGGVLYFKLNKVDSMLEHVSGNDFRFRVPGAGKFTLTFTVKEGRVQSLTFNIGDPIGEFHKIG